jgi:polar amino acid transport system substrate-binding protein
MKKYVVKKSWVAWLIGTAAVLVYGGTATAADLSVCVDKSSPTAAMDRGLAQAVAVQEGNTLQLHEFDGSGGGDDDGFSLKEFNKLAKASCALVLGFPVDADSAGVPAGLLATAPYGHTGFVLVTPKGSNATTLDQLPKNTDVAVTYQTTPNLYFVDHPGVNADVRLTDDDALRAMEKHTVHAAMLWQPTVVKYLASRHEVGHFNIHELNERHARFNLVALYDHDHADTAQSFDKAITALSDSGQLAKLLAPYAQTGAATPSRRGTTAMLRRSSADGRLDRRCGSKKPAEKSAGQPPALYTSAQADSGKIKFLTYCAMCHGPTLQGRSGPALTGPNFASAKADFHVSDVFGIVANNMPATAPGTLAHDDYVEIMAFLLQQNGYPAGSNALTFEDATKSKTKLLYRSEPTSNK